MPTKNDRRARPGGLRYDHITTGRSESHPGSSRARSAAGEGKTWQSAPSATPPAAGKSHRKNNAVLSFFHQLIVFDDRIRKQIATKLVQTGLDVGAIALEVNLQVFANPDIFHLAHPEMLHCFPHGRALRIEHGDFRHHYHFGFHLFNLRAQGRRDNGLLRQEISFKAHIAALVVAANGSTSRHANAIARSARDGLFRQRLPDSYYRWPCSRGRFCGWQRLRAEPRHPRFHVDRASPDPGTAVNAGGTTSGESEIGHASQRGEEPSGNHH